MAIVENIGYAAAVNRCVRSLDSSISSVFFMNDDVTLVGAPPTPADATIQVPLQNGTPDLHYLPTPRGFLLGWILGRNPPAARIGDPLPEGTAANGAALVVPRRVLESTPLPSEYFLYWEETAWFWRVRDAGVQSRVVDVRVDRPAGAREKSPAKAELLGLNLVRIGMQRYGRPAAVLYLAMGMAWVARLSVTDLLAGRFDRLRMRRLTIVGLLRSIRVGPTRTYVPT